MKHGLIIVLSGPAGSGKGTVIKQLLTRDDFLISVSRTTRAPRPGEVDGRDYYFITREEFDRFIAEGDFLEHAEYCTNKYGTPKKDTEEIIATGKNVILEIEVEGAMQIRRSCPDAVLIMLLPPSFRTQEERLRGRGTETPDIIEKRLLRTHAELEHFKYYDYVINIPDNATEQAVADIVTVARAEGLSVKRNTDAAAKYFD